jgi:hypothetical protein
MLVESTCFGDLSFKDLRTVSLDEAEKSYSLYWSV